MKRISLEETSRLLKKKTALCALWNCEDRKNWPYQLGYLVYKDLFKEVFLFDPKAERLRHGSEIMKNKMFDIIKNKKPNYAFLLLEANDISLDTLEKIKEISPNTKTLAIFGDDDIHFETRSRYYALFLDYCIFCPIKYLSSYRNDGIMNSLPFAGGVNTENFKPLKLEKKYDVVCIGKPVPASRAEAIRFLIKNGIKVNIWGYGWDNYPEFKEVYGGPLEHNEMVKVINQTKIYLGFCKNKLGEAHNTGKFFESAACGTFCLVDEFPEYQEYFNNNEIVNFSDNNDLLNKARYYLKNEKERERIARNAHKKTIKNHSYHMIYRKIFQRIFMMEDSKTLLKLDNKVIRLSEEDMNLDYSSIEEKLKDYSYVCFSEGKSLIHKHKNFLQAYSLEKTGKDISCCDYFVFSQGIGRYLKSDAFRASLNVKKEEFNKLLNINQIMLRKEYFMRHFDSFKKFYNLGEINIIDKDNVAFIEIPLVQINRLNKISKDCLYNLDSVSLENSFQFRFMFELYLLLYQKRLLFNKYLYRLVIESIMKWDTFILKYLFNSLFNKEKRLRIKNLI